MATVVIALLSTRLSQSKGLQLVLHAGNILVKKAASGNHELVPIDHGYVLPDTFQDISFEWLYWPQARAPFGKRSEVIICSNASATWCVLLILQGLGWHKP